MIGIQNLRSNHIESRMQYPWLRIENPRLSDSLAWDDHCFQLDKIKDIICFHYFIFGTRKNSHKDYYYVWLQLILVLFRHLPLSLLIITETRPFKNVNRENANK